MSPVSFVLPNTKSDAFDSKPRCRTLFSRHSHPLRWGVSLDGAPTKWSALRGPGTSDRANKRTTLH